MGGHNVFKRPADSNGGQILGRPHQSGARLSGSGRMTMDGAVVDRKLVRPPAEPLAEDTMPSLNHTADWRADARLVLQDTPQLSFRECVATLELQFEEFTITPSEGTHVSLERPPTYSHEGMRNADGVQRRTPRAPNQAGEPEARWWYSSMHWRRDHRRPSVPIDACTFPNCRSASARRTAQSQRTATDLSAPHICDPWLEPELSEDADFSAVRYRKSLRFGVVARGVEHRIRECSS